MRLYQTVILGALCFTLSAPASQAGWTKQDKKKDKKGVDSQQKLEFDALFINACKEKNIGNLDAALTLFMKCAVKDPSNDAVLYNIGQIYLAQKKELQALPYIQSAVKNSPDNIYYKQTLGEVYIRNRNYSEALDLYKGLSKEYPENPEYLYQLATLYIYQEKLADAVNVYDKLEDRMGINPEISMAKQRIYLKLGKTDKAAKELEKLIKAFPTQIEYYGMLAELYQANNMEPKAIELYKKMQEIDPDNGYVHLSLADYYRDKKENQRSFDEIKKAFQSKNLEIETKLKILASYFTLVDGNPMMKSQAFELNKILVDMHPNDAQAHVFYAEFLYQDKQLVPARDEFKKSILLDKQSFNVWRQLLSVEFDLKEYESVINLSDEAITLFPTQSVLFFFNGIAKMQTKKYQEAIAILKQGADLTIDNKELKAEFFANIGEAYYQLKDSKLSDMYYDRCLVLDQKNANAMNNYSYYLSLRGDSLEKAEMWSRKSNEIEPNNSYYQDTYAWVLFKLGKYEDAKMWLEKAMKAREGDSAVIFEHYGDVLFKMGDIAGAVENWTKAKNAGANSESLNKKIATKKMD